MLNTRNYMVDFVLNKCPKLIHSTHCPFQGAPLAGWTLIPMMYHHTRGVKASSFETAVRVSGTFFWASSMKKKKILTLWGRIGSFEPFRAIQNHIWGVSGQMDKINKNKAPRLIKQEGWLPSVTSKLHNMWRQFSKRKELHFKLQQPWAIRMARSRHYVLECVHIYISPRLITYRWYNFNEII